MNIPKLVPDRVWLCPLCPSGGDPPKVAYASAGKCNNGHKLYEATSGTAAAVMQDAKRAAGCQPGCKGKHLPANPPAGLPCPTCGDAL